MFIQVKVFSLVVEGPGRDGNSLRRDDIGNFSCVVSSAASSEQVSKDIFLSVECMYLRMK